MKYARPDSQLALLALPAPRYVIECAGQARCAYGAAVQEIVCAALGLAPIPIDGTCEVCFDGHRDGVDFEIKSVHEKGKVVCYDWRLEKEAAAQDEGRKLCYAIFAHNVRGETDTGKLFERMIAGGKLLLMPAATVRLYAFAEPLQSIRKVDDGTGSKRIGYNRAGYARGYRNLPVSRLIHICDKFREVRFDFYGSPKTLPVWTS